MRFYCIYIDEYIFLPNTVLKILKLSPISLEPSIRYKEYSGVTNTSIMYEYQETKGCSVSSDDRPLGTTATS